MLPEKRYGVWLYSDRVGTLNQRGDYTWFSFTNEYREDPNRPVLGLVFEQNLLAKHAAAMRLPPWFSNLLPEGLLRSWIAVDRGVSVQREMELLAQVGHDLPGAVQVFAEEGAPEGAGWDPVSSVTEPYIIEREEVGRGWRFSLAGVGLKFSMLQQGDRLTLPAFGQGGDWIVKLPDASYADVPRNENAMMSLARAVGIDVPEHMLVHRDQLENLPSRIWPGKEEYAYAVKRFDRGEGGSKVHIEDLAQVRNIYQDGKYDGNFETAANLLFRGRDMDSLREFTRRLAFNILISNGDAHLKNWSLIYSDKRKPEISPAYDLVSTRIYQVGDSEDLGLKFHGHKRFNVVTLNAFERLERKLDAHGAQLKAHAAEMVDRVYSEWPRIADTLADRTDLMKDIGDSIDSRRRTLLAK